MIVIFVPVVLLLAAAALAYIAGVHRGRTQVLSNPARHGLTRGPVPVIDLDFPSTTSDEDAEHARAAFLAAVQAGRLHLGRGPVIPK